MLPNLNNVEDAPDFDNPIIEALVGSHIYSEGTRIYYLLEGRGTNNALGGNRWRSADAADAFLNALDAWRDVTNIDVRPYPFPHTEGDEPTDGLNTWFQKFSFLDDRPILGFHEGPASDNRSRVQEGGYNNQHPLFTAENNAVGGYSFVTFLHIIGLAMGLSQPHEDDLFPGVSEGVAGWLDTGDFGLNQSIFTIMSFIRGSVDKGWSDSFAYGWQATPGAFDIAAVQAIYGVNTSTRTGDDVYTIPGVNEAGTYYATIWDAGGEDTLSAQGVTRATTIDLRAATLEVAPGGGGWLSSASGIFGGFTIANGVEIENAVGGEANDTITGNDVANTLTGGLGDDVIDGGSGIDTAVFAGGFGDYTISQRSPDVFEISGPDGTDTLTNVEILRFDNLQVQLDLGSGLSIDPDNDDPNGFMVNIRDYDGNDIGAAFNWVRIGEADVNLNGRTESIFVNSQNGRFAEVAVNESGLVQFDNHGQGGDTRVVGIYIDPLVQSGDVGQGSPFDSQQRFQNDLFIGNIAQVLGSQDFDGDGFAEIYFSLTDGTAYLRALMHADGNIQYANYQSEEQVIEYLAANGYGEETFGTWFDDGAETAAEQAAVSTADVTMAWQPQDSALAAEFFG